MERIVNTALISISMYLWVYKKYGIAAMLTKNLAKHAAVGRAKWKAFWNVPVRDHRQLCMESASEMVARLRAERTAGYALAA